MPLKSIHLALVALLAGLVLPASCCCAAQEPNVGGPFAHGVVAADHPLASQAGLEMLQAGGNVVDAAVATSFALSVVRPASCGMGGGGFMLIWDAADKRAVALDYRERAPLAATADMFSEPAAEDSEAASVRGGRAVAVPGSVAGLCYAAEKYGTLPLSKLLEPAIRYAEQGILVDATDRANQVAALQKIERYPGYRETYAAFVKGYLNDGEPFAEGDRFHSPQLPVLRLIAEHGRSGFYAGPVARAIVETARRHGGVISEADLAQMHPVQRVPLRGSFDGREVLTMPPPSSGGVALLQMLNALQAWEQRNPDQRMDIVGHSSPVFAHVLVETMKHAFADRAEYLGDTDFADVPIQRLLSLDYADKIAQRIDLKRTHEPAEYGRFFAASDSGTSHFSVIDREGNAVACTETINLGYGSFVVVPRYGILLNDEMDDFAARPGEPNAFGLMQSAANAVAPRKKPLSSMTPTIVVQDGQATAAIGGSGGPKIITATMQVLLNQVRFGMLPQQAVDAPRLHHQWFPNRVLLEPPLVPLVGPGLERRGHTVRKTDGVGVTQSASRRPAGVYGGSDKRKRGRPAGF